MSRKLEIKQVAGRIVVGRRPDLKRLDELKQKVNKSQAEELEEIRLRLQRIMEHLGIED